MNSDVGMLGDGARQRRAFVADEIDLDTVRRQRTGVVLHPGASAEVGERESRRRASLGLVARRFIITVNFECLTWATAVRL